MRIPADVAKVFLNADRDDGSFPGLSGNLTPQEPQQMFLRAVRLARRGHYAQAEEALATLGGQEGMCAKALDLLAKIRAQQGRYLDAEACWRKALSLEPGNQQYQAALHAIAEDRRRPLWLHVASAAIVATVFCAVVLMLGFGIAQVQLNRVERSITAGESRLLERINALESRLSGSSTKSAQRAGSRAPDTRPAGLPASIAPAPIGREPGVRPGAQ